MEKSYRNYNDSLKIGKEEVEIGYTRDAKQEDNITPTIIVGEMQLVVEDTLAHLIY